MKINKHLATLAAGSALAMGTGLVAPVSAYTVDGDRYTVACNEMQDVIDNAIQSSGEIWLSENCQADLTIPSGKEISLYSHVNSGGQSEWYTISNVENDTITVEEGATLYLHAHTSNNSNGKAAIRNAGVTYIRGALTAENGAYTAINSGELNFGGLDSDTDPIHSGVSFQNTGTIRVAQGTFDNAENVRPYLINGAEINNETGLVTTPEDYLHSLAENINLVRDIWDIESAATGYTTTLHFAYPEYATATGVKVYSTDQSVLEVTGSNAEGWTVTAKKEGEASLVYIATGIAAGRNIKVYDLEIDIDGEGTTNPYISNYIANDLTEEQRTAIKNALDNGETISVSVAVEPLDDDVIEDGDKEKIAEVLGNDKAIAYYDIDLAIFGSESGKLATINDLGDQEDAVVMIRIPAAFLAGLSAVEDGYTRSFYAIRMHNGLAEKIPTTLDGDDLIIESGKFSTYVIAYADTIIPVESDDEAINDSLSSDKQTTSTPANTPETGTFTGTSQKDVQPSAIAMAAAMISLAGLGIAIKRRLFRK